MNHSTVVGAPRLLLSISIRACLGVSTDVFRTSPMASLTFSSSWPLPVERVWGRAMTGQ